MSFWDKIRGVSPTKGLKEFEPGVLTVNSFEEAVRKLTDEELKGKTVEFREKLGIITPDNINKENNTQNLNKEEKQKQYEKEQKILKEILPEAFAVVREAARRTLGQRHFDVQLIGGMILNSGAIAEMRTGEGKTLVATLSAYLNALTGRGVHIVTVNDYLSRRDAVWMGQIYNALGLSVAVINHESSFIYDPNHRQKVVDGTNEPEDNSGKNNSTSNPRTGDNKMEVGENSTDPLDKERDETGAFKVVHEFLRPCTRREAYAADITYGTNNEFGFDFLRDNLEYSADRLRQREFNYAIVDEIDSILIDEARTPLIISAPTRDAESIYKQFASLVSSFNENEDYTVEEKHKAIQLTEAGITKAEKSLGVDNIYTDKGVKYVHHLETAIRAKALYHKDKEYVVRDSEVMIVDEFTGRLQPGRRWSEGLHQAIEAKEGVKIQQESRTYASITFQNFFRMYPKLSGMTGTAATSSEEFFKVYGLEVCIVPTNMKAIRLDKNDQIFRTEIGKFKAISKKVKELHAKGQPVLIGTVSIEKNQLLSDFLKADGIPHTILNAKPEFAEKEGEIVAQAGKKGGVTIATNMAGRGVDIKLGGNPNTKEKYEEIKSFGGLFVLGTERHEARRIDNQLRGRSGRQGDPGETQFFVSLEDTLMRVFASDALKSMMGKLGMPEDEAIEHKLISRALESAQEKIEGFNFDSRKHVLEFDDIINNQRRSVYDRRRKLLLGSIDDVEVELFGMLGIDKNDFDGQTIGGGVTTEHEIGNSTEHVGADTPQSETVAERVLGSHSGSVDSESAPVINPEMTGIQQVITRKIKEYGREPFLSAMRIVLLQTIDMYWVEHLEVMDYTRSSVNLRAYGQRDPLVEYKKEGLRLFKEMQEAVRGQVERLIPNIIPTVNGVPLDKAVNSDMGELNEVHENAQIIGKGSDNKSVGSAKKEEVVGRNDPCPCGSGKKYKKCHGK